MRSLRTTVFYSVMCPKSLQNSMQARLPTVNWEYVPLRPMDTCSLNVHPRDKTVGRITDLKIAHLMVFLGTQKDKSLKIHSLPLNAICLRSIMCRKYNHRTNEYHLASNHSTKGRKKDTTFVKYSRLRCIAFRELPLVPSVVVPIIF